MVTTGGTGLTPGDLTPEMTRMIIDREIPGIAEAIRAAGVNAGIPAAMLSRGLAGLAGHDAGRQSPRVHRRGAGTAWLSWVPLSLMPWIRPPGATIRARMTGPQGRSRAVHARPDSADMYGRAMMVPWYMRAGWPATLTEPSLLSAPVALRPLAARDARPWREARVRNADWLRPWEPTNPETPLYQTNLGPYIAMVRTMRREARRGVTLPWVVLYDGRFAGQLTVGNIVWGSARTASVGYWID